MPGVSPNSVSQECLPGVSFQECHAKSVMPRVSPKSVFPRVSSQEGLSKSVMPRVSPKSVMSGVSSQECLPGVSSKSVMPGVSPNRECLPRVSCQECREDLCEHSGSWASYCFTLTCLIFFILSFLPHPFIFRT